MNPAEDAQLERRLGKLLRLGVIVSSLCLAVGLSMTLRAASPSGRLMLDAGVILLLAIPAVRVVFSAATYAMRRDWLFAGLVVIVLLELLAGLYTALQGNSGAS